MPWTDRSADSCRAKDSKAAVDYAQAEADLIEALMAPWEDEPGAAHQRGFALGYAAAKLGMVRYTELMLQYGSIGRRNAIAHAA